MRIKVIKMYSIWILKLHEYKPNNIQPDNQMQQWSKEYYQLQSLYENQIQHKHCFNHLLENGLFNTTWVW